MLYFKSRLNYQLDRKSIQSKDKNFYWASTISQALRLGGFCKTKKDNIPALRELTILPALTLNDIWLFQKGLTYALKVKIQPCYKF